MGSATPCCRAPRPAPAPPKPQRASMREPKPVVARLEAALLGCHIQPLRKEKMIMNKAMLLASEGTPMPP